MLAEFCLAQAAGRSLLLSAASYARADITAKSRPATKQPPMYHLHVDIRHKRVQHTQQIGGWRRRLQLLPGGVVSAGWLQGPGEADGPRVSAGWWSIVYYHVLLRTRLYRIGLGSRPGRVHPVPGRISASRNTASPCSPCPWRATSYHPVRGTRRGRDHSVHPSARSNRLP